MGERKYAMTDTYSTSKIMDELVINIKTLNQELYAYLKAEDDADVSKHLRNVRALLCERYRIAGLLELNEQKRNE